MAEQHKRPREDDLPTFDDPADLVNAVISTLQIPEERTNVATDYANDKNLATEVQAYAKIAGRDWTYYVRSLSISIGRNTENNQANPPPSQQNVNIDLGPAKVVSRQHAAIKYNMDLKCWELKVLGRNGARIDGNKVPVGAEHATPLHSGAILDIGGTQMMFILPDAPPSISQKMLSVCLSRYKSNSNKMPNVSNNLPRNTTMHQPSNSMRSFLGVTGFQMFDKANLTNSPSAVSAVSLQNNLDQDLSKEDAKDIKPPYSYATMITQAILSNPDGVMSLSEIYNWISSHYAYYKYSKAGWQNSIRHNLSLNKAFEKVPRRPNEPGKGMKWQISESYKEDFMKKIQNGTLSKSRRGSSVSRTLQIHLATHQSLPESQGFSNENRQMMDYRGTPNGDHMYQKINQPMPYTGLPPNQMQPQMNYGGQSMNGYSMQQFNGPPGFSGNPQMPNQPQLQHHHQQQQHQQQFMPTLGGDNKTLASPLKHNPRADSNTPKLPKVGSNHVFNLPPPTPGASHQGNSNFAFRGNEQASRATEHANGNDVANSTSQGNISEIQQSSTAPTTSNTSELGIGYTSPKKITPLEAFTPERGSRASGMKLGLPNNGNNVTQSSPAFWNFVQFSTPNGQTPGRKNSDESNDQASPTHSRRPTNVNDAKEISDSKVNGSPGKTVTPPK
ncbi:hypothetical protein FT663_04717 [Candidozyma haemuli var. vulneris]|uniref:Fork-head transcriptional regulator 2 n=1 Tax=Candidozyma haemuli TaxID=45357 RepID=A0A2V1AQT6_9ASCO|nr:hypothetical protein CXQ85_002218 [[Candida] haemuloni]KAF3986000.1 hypothetical protein FT662_04822 [[Candida] haemuloni var. vulneris]KAF3986810.1 hypothetical protein FT663_04717 [[Candida] haemuloni var. vulneris]PVH20430.1 hypothetical protein CXQ85_002218 [[Candida] haemuloni]